MFENVSWSAAAVNAALVVGFTGLGLCVLRRRTAHKRPQGASPAQVERLVNQAVSNERVAGDEREAAAILAGRRAYLAGQPYDGRISQGAKSRWRWYLRRNGDLVAQSGPRGEAEWSRSAEEFFTLFPGVPYNVEHPEHPAKP